jgi:ribulose bisphosphate carboxylase small subunit
MVDLCERYFEFLKIFNTVARAHKDYQSNPKHYEDHKIVTEWSNVTNIKEEAEQKILSSMEKFVNNYKDEYNQILKGYDDIVKSIIQHETDKLKYLD